MSAASAAAVVVLLAAAAVRDLPVTGARIAALARARLEPPAWFVRACADAVLPVPPPVAWTGWVWSSGFAAVPGAVAGRPALVLAGPVSVAAGGALALACRRGQAARTADAALPDVVDALARALRTGASLGQAITEVASAAPGPLGDELGVVAAEVGAGQPLVPALDGWAARAATPGSRLVAAAVALSAETGGAAARALDGVAATLRANNGVLGELRAQSAQARLSALVIALAPLAFGVLALGTDRRTASFLLGTPAGLACLLAGLGLDGVAAWWMQRITASVG